MQYYSAVVLLLLSQFKVIIKIKKAEPTLRVNSAINKSSTNILQQILMYSMCRVCNYKLIRLLN